MFPCLSVDLTLGARSLNEVKAFFLDLVQSQGSPPASWPLLDSLKYGRGGSVFVVYCCVHVHATTVCARACVCACVYEHMSMKWQFECVRKG